MTKTLRASLLVLVIAAGSVRAQPFHFSWETLPAAYGGAENTGTSFDGVLFADDELRVVVNPQTPLPPTPVSCSFLGKTVAAVEEVTLSGNATIAGSVQAGDAFSGYGNAVVTGDVTAAQIVLAGNASVGGSAIRIAGTPLPAPPFDVAAAFASAENGNNNASIPPGLIVDGALVLNSRAQLTLAGGVYFFSGMNLSGQSRLSAVGDVTIFLRGPLSITGGSVVNDHASGNLWIFSDSADPLHDAGRSRSAYNLYAPAAPLTIEGSTELAGCVAARLVMASGDGLIVHAPSSGPGGEGGSVVRITSPVNGGAVRGLTQVTVSASAAAPIQRIELWVDGALVQNRRVDPPRTSVTAALDWTPHGGASYSLQARSYDIEGAEEISPTITVAKARGRISLVRTDGSGASSSSEGGRSLVLSLSRGSRQALRFEEDVEEVSIMNLNGRVALTKRKEGAPIEVQLQSADATSLGMESGLWLIQTKNAQGKSHIQPLVVVK